MSTTIERRDGDDEKTFRLRPPEERRLRADAADQAARELVARSLMGAPPTIRAYTGHLGKSAGKFLRGRCLIECARDENGEVHYNAVRLAAAIEILHLATLVHDDVIDDAEFRRGEASLQNRYGRRTAVICGDFLLCLALQLAGRTTAEEHYGDTSLPDYLTRICLGELAQHANNGNLELTVRQYLKIISGKTAALFEAAFRGGAVVAGEEPGRVSRYAAMGRYLGMIFQLTDDCMDFESTGQAAGKPVRSDYEQGVVTLPLIHLFRLRPELLEQARGRALGREQIDRAVRETGSLDYSRAIARRYLVKAEALLAGLSLNERKEGVLRDLIRQAYREF